MASKPVKAPGVPAVVRGPQEGDHLIRHTEPFLVRSGQWRGEPKEWTVGFRMQDGHMLYVSLRGEADLLRLRDLTLNAAERAGFAMQPPGLTNEGFQALKSVVREVLEWKPFHMWTLQGFGMLRTNVGADRIHVWDKNFAVEGVTTVHDHPWDFSSIVVAGKIVNRRYRLVDAYTWRGPTAPSHHQQRIVCGLNGGAAGEPTDVRLDCVAEETLEPGDVYFQESGEIHESIPEDGTVTVITRRYKTDTEHAHVFFPLGTKWVSAIPRAATRDEVAAMTSKAIARLEGREIKPWNPDDDM